jgi:hypothetical protein
MKKIIGSVFFLIFFLFAGINQLFSQVVINKTGNPPDPSAMLDVQSTNKGFLLPRIDFNNRPNPAPAGLMIFVTANGPLGNNALYLYDGNGWLKIAYTGISLYQQIGGGIVFYLDPTGYHGLISSTVDQTADAAWGCDGTLIGPGAENTGLGTGNINTAAIVAACSDPGIAAKVCDTLTLNGFTDWYLPAIDELDSMYVHKDTIGGFVNGWYWSSTEHDSLGAWIYIFDLNEPAWTSKAYPFINVRCIRKF